MSELFSVEIPAISKHLSNIYAEGELNASTTVSKMEIVQQEGVWRVKRNVDFYNLDAIISVGYRVNSRRATQFRIWARGETNTGVCQMKGLKAKQFLPAISHRLGKKAALTLRMSTESYVFLRVNTPDFECTHYQR